MDWGYWESTKWESSREERVWRQWGEKWEGICKLSIVQLYYHMTIPLSLHFLIILFRIIVHKYTQFRPHTRNLRNMPFYEITMTKNIIKISSWNFCRIFLFDAFFEFEFFWCTMHACTYIHMTKNVLPQINFSKLAQWFFLMRNYPIL